MKSLYDHLPDTPGVYLMKNKKGELLYVGKAGNLKRRVASYFLRPHDRRIEKLVNQINKIDYKKTDTAIEALILEAELIKKHTPPYNIREKDDKSFLYVEITNEPFPRILLVRGKQRKAAGERPVPSPTKDHALRSVRKQQERSLSFGVGFGPFTSATSIRGALKIIRRIFPYSTHAPLEPGKTPRACFDYQIGLCPGTCIGEIPQSEYGKNIRNITLFFEGKKRLILRRLEREMHTCAKSLRFEEAEKLKRKIFSLRHIQDVAFITDNETADSLEEVHRKRIEGYDISNISGTSAVGSMVVFLGNTPDTAHYRKFKIKTIRQANDVGMLKEVFRRRFAREDWPLPDLILVDGGRGQVRTLRETLYEANLKIPIVGIAKGAERKRNDIIGIIPKFTTLGTLIHVRDEAHRFAISYHKHLRGKNFIPKRKGLI